MPNCVLPGSDSPLNVKPSMLPGHLPPNYFGSPLGLLHFQQQLQQQAINSSLFPRGPGTMSLPYQSHLSASSLLGGTSGLPPTSMAGPWSPYFLFARQPQPQPGSNMAAANENAPPNGLPVHLHNQRYSVVWRYPQHQIITFQTIITKNSYLIIA